MGASTSTSPSTTPAPNAVETAEGFGGIGATEGIATGQDTRAGAEVARDIPVGRSGANASAALKSARINEGLVKSQAKALDYDGLAKTLTGAIAENKPEVAKQAIDHLFARILAQRDPSVQPAINPKLLEEAIANGLADPRASNKTISRVFSHLETIMRAEGFNGGPNAVTEALRDIGKDGLAKLTKHAQDSQDFDLRSQADAIAKSAGLTPHEMKDVLANRVYEVTHTPYNSSGHVNLALKELDRREATVRALNDRFKLSEDPSSPHAAQVRGGLTLVNTQRHDIASGATTEYFRRNGHKAIDGDFHSQIRDIAKRGGLSEEEVRTIAKNSAKEATGTRDGLSYDDMRERLAYARSIGRHFGLQKDADILSNSSYVGVEFKRQGLQKIEQSMSGEVNAASIKAIKATAEEAGISKAELQQLAAKEAAARIARSSGAGADLAAASALEREFARHDASIAKARTTKIEEVSAANTDLAERLKGIAALKGDLSKEDVSAAVFAGTKRHFDAVTNGGADTQKLLDLQREAKSLASEFGSRAQDRDLLDSLRKPAMIQAIKLLQDNSSGNFSANLAQVDQLSKAFELDKAKPGAGAAAEPLRAFAKEVAINLIGEYQAAPNLETQTKLVQASAIVKKFGLQDDANVVASRKALEGSISGNQQIVLGELFGSPVSSPNPEALFATTQEE